MIPVDLNKCRIRGCQFPVEWVGEIKRETAYRQTPPGTTIAYCRHHGPEKAHILDNMRKIKSKEEIMKEFWEEMNS